MQNTFLPVLQNSRLRAIINNALVTGGEWFVMVVCKSTMNVNSLQSSTPSLFILRCTRQTARQLHLPIPKVNGWKGHAVITILTVTVTRSQLEDIPASNRSYQFCDWHIINYWKKNQCSLFARLIRSIQFM